MAAVPRAAAPAPGSSPSGQVAAVRPWPASRPAEAGRLRRAAERAERS